MLAEVDVLAMLIALVATLVGLAVDSGLQRRGEHRRWLRDVRYRAYVEASYRAATWSLHITERRMDLAGDPDGSLLLRRPTPEGDRPGFGESEMGKFFEALLAVEAIGSERMRRHARLGDEARPPAPAPGIGRAPRPHIGPVEDQG